MLNRIKGENTTVSDLIQYESKKYVKYVTQSSHLVAIRSWQALYERVKSKENVKFSGQNVDHISHISIRNGVWNIKCREENIVSKYLIYTDHEAIYRTLIEGNPKIPDFGHEILGETTAILHQLTSVRYVNCLFSFKDKIVMR